jgi:hypothetical protein
MHNEAQYSFISQRSTLTRGGDYPELYFLFLLFHARVMVGGSAKRKGVGRSVVGGGYDGCCGLYGLMPLPPPPPPPPSSRHRNLRRPAIL